jgi:hypothetical protein
LTNNGRLAILVPSRGRPITFARFAETWLARTAGCSDIIVRNGSDDPSAPEYAEFDGIPGIIRYVGDDGLFRDTITGNAGYLPAQQEMWEKYPGYAAYMCTEDDTTFEETNFDTTLLALFNNFPNRVGMVKCLDLACQIEIQCFSDTWCNALGWLWPKEGGEPFFNAMPVLADGLATLGPAMCHHPLLRSHGYTGNERRGAMETPDIVAKFHGETRRMEGWLNANYIQLRQKIKEAASRGTRRLIVDPYARS